TLYLLNFQNFSPILRNLKYGRQPNCVVLLKCSSLYRRCELSNDVTYTYAY
ncbi:hypothetical protein L9F63_013529, partial [Diploptera punctata]